MSWRLISHTAPNSPVLGSFSTSCMPSLTKKRFLPRPDPAVLLPICRIDIFKVVQARAGSRKKAATSSARNSLRLSTTSAPALISAAI